MSYCLHPSSELPSGLWILLTWQYSLSAPLGKRIWSPATMSVCRQALQHASGPASLVPDQARSPHYLAIFLNVHSFLHTVASALRGSWAPSCLKLPSLFPLSWRAPARLYFETWRQLEAPAPGSSWVLRDTGPQPNFHGASLPRIPLPRSRSLAGPTGHTMYPWIWPSRWAGSKWGSQVCAHVRWGPIEVAGERCVHSLCVARTLTPEPRATPTRRRGWVAIW